MKSRTESGPPRFEDRLLDMILDQHEAVVSRPARERIALPLHRVPRPMLALGVVIAAVAGVVAGVAIFPMAQRPGAGAGAPTAETVSYRTTAALSQASASDVEYARSVYMSRAGTPTSSVEVWSYGGQGLAADRVRIETFNADGSPGLDDSGTTLHGTRIGRVVNYSARSWFATSERAPAPLSCDVVCRIRQDLSDGFFNAVTRTALGNHPALELSRTGPTANSATAPLSGSEERLTIWIDPATYLPMRITVSRPGETVRTTVEWLAPTQANLARLTAAVPPGFTRVSGPPGQQPPAAGVRASSLNQP
jgi:hypothetical protein